MLLTDCGICGRRDLGVNRKGTAEAGGLMRVARHRRAGGGPWCIVTQVDPGTLREAPRSRRPRR